jgi:predicted transcriptional regulator YdeE
MNKMDIGVTMIAMFAMSLMAFAGPGGGSLTPKIVEEAGFKVVGIAARTSNAKEMSGQGVIGKQWERFLKDGLLSKIPNREDSNILAVYTDYESDANGDYTFILGAKVSSADNIPSGMVLKKVPGGKYAIFTSERGLVEKVVPETWAHIWSLPKSAPGGDRAYRADFELYDGRAADPRNAQVDIYVGIK